MSDSPIPATMTLKRGLDLLRAFRAERTPLTNAELVRRTGLSRSSVSRLTITLVKLGYLRRVSGGRALELSVGGLSIGTDYARSNPVTQRVHPVMQRLADRLDVSVALAVPDRLDMLYIACRTSAQISTLRLEVGSLLPMGRTAIGRAWLWALPASERRRYIQGLLEAAGPEADDLWQRIKRDFDQIDSTGACITVGEYQRNAYGIALPVRLGRSQTLMAMSCGGVGLALDIAAIRNCIAPELKRASREITTLLRNVDAEP